LLKEEGKVGDGPSGEGLLYYRDKRVMAVAGGVHSRKVRRAIIFGELQAVVVVKKWNKS